MVDHAERGATVAFATNVLDAGCEHLCLGEGEAHCCGHLAVYWLFSLPRFRKVQGVSEHRFTYRIT